MSITLTKVPKKANFLTHAGKFHADEVFATVILEKTHRKMVVARVQNVPAKIDEKVFVYDIGRGEFDHHQAGGNGARKNSAGKLVKYAACGLVWREFGRAVITKYLERHFKELGYSSFYQISDEVIAELVGQVDREFIQQIDADDNGEERYALSDVIAEFNPAWNEKADSDKCFMEAVKVATEIFERVLTHEVAHFAAKGVVEEALEEAKNGILVLDKRVTYEPAIFSSTNPKAKELLYVIYPSSRRGYDVKAVPEELGSFKNRKDLPAEWAGLVDADLQEVTGVKTASFCHNSRFLAVADTLEDALKLAEKAVGKKVAKNE